MSGKELKHAELAWPEGDLPSDGFIHFPADPEVQDLIKAAVIPALECGGKWDNVSIVSITPQAGIPGRFRLDSEDNDFFLRITSRAGHPVLEKKICEYLLEKGASINPVIATKNMTLNGQDMRIDLRPFIAGSHFSGDLNQLESLGRSIAEVHKILKGFPMSSEVRSIASTRFSHYADVIDAVFADIRGIGSVLNHYSDWFERNIKWLGEMAENFNPSFNLMDDAQCIHGEIHPGNVIFVKNHGRAVLLDFEESVHVFAPESWDLAFAVQRFILRDNPSTSETRKRISVFEKGYGKKLPYLSEMMRQIAWFSMAVVMDLFINNSIITPISELEKFVRLERQAFSFLGVI